MPSLVADEPVKKIAEEGTEASRFREAKIAEVSQIISIQDGQSGFNPRNGRLREATPSTKEMRIDQYLFQLGKTVGKPAGRRTASLIDARDAMIDYAAKGLLTHDRGAIEAQLDTFEVSYRRELSALTRAGAKQAM